MCCVNVEAMRWMTTSWRAASYARPPSSPEMRSGRVGRHEPRVTGVESLRRAMRRVPTTTESSPRRGERRVPRRTTAPDITTSDSKARRLLKTREILLKTLSVSTLVRRCRRPESSRRRRRRLAASWPGGPWRTRLVRSPRAARRPPRSPRARPPPRRPLERLARTSPEKSPDPCRVWAVPRASPARRPSLRPGASSGAPPQRSRPSGSSGRPMSTRKPRSQRTETTSLAGPSNPRTSGAKEIDLGSAGDPSSSWSPSRAPVRTGFAPASQSPGCRSPARHSP